MKNAVSRSKVTDPAPQSSLVVIRAVGAVLGSIHGTSEFAHEAGVAPKALGGIQVALAQTQQMQIGFQDVTVSSTREHAKLWIDQHFDIDALEVFAD
jgi:hypothetical protein